MIIKLAGYSYVPRSRLPANLDLSLWVNVTENLKRFFLFLYPYIRTNKEDRNTDVNIYIYYIYMFFDAGHQRGDRGVPGTVVAGLLGREV